MTRNSFSSLAEMRASELRPSGTMAMSFLKVATALETGLLADCGGVVIISGLSGVGAAKVVTEMVRKTEKKFNEERMLGDGLKGNLFLVS